jgi:energy-coupling factor transporter ATP-binding protein EcfA2
MRVRRISVQKLFGIFDHTIPLKMEERITILHGLNGYGKTIVLRMVNGLLTGEYDLFRTIPFHEFVLEFDAGAKLIVEQGDAKRVPLRYMSAEGEERSLSLTTSDKDPAWFEKVRRSVRVHLVRTQRLEMRKVTDEGNPYMYGNPSVYGGTYLGQSVYWSNALGQTSLFAEHVTVPTVNQYSDEIVGKINAALTHYASKSQELDRTFPRRLLKDPSQTMAAEEVKARLERLDKRRLRLADLGFIDPKEHQDLGQGSVEGPQLGVLGLYVNDVEEKLGVFDALADKIELFTEIVNKRFLYKRLAIRRDKGFVLISEQHELILLYEMLFEVDPGSLVLIDEPEISLHIAWQNELLRDLERIVKLVGFDVLLATHSPDIIGDRWDLTVRLVGPKDGDVAKAA